VVARGWSEAQKKAYVIADNQLTINGGWGEGLLRTELQDLAEMKFDLGLTGFSVDQINFLSMGTTGLTDPDDVPPAPPDPVSRWVMCGSSGSTAWSVAIRPMRLLWPGRSTAKSRT
jgi:hypothetical protein